jgi:hypothetical protein
MEKSIGVWPSVEALEKRLDLAFEVDVSGYEVERAISRPLLEAIIRWA